MIYKNYERNHVIFPGRKDALKGFLNTQYKKVNETNSNSEDALTWSCFDTLNNLSPTHKKRALVELFEDSFQEEGCGSFFEKYNDNEIEIFIGKDYHGINNEKTELDASIETPDKVIFIEAKLYSSISLVDKDKPHNQIARKLRVGLDYAHKEGKSFYFIFLDIAPPVKLIEFTSEVKSKENAQKHPERKWKSAWWFNYYKKGRNNSLKPLKDILSDIEYDSIESVAYNMGWLTWSDLFKIVMRGMISEKY